MHGGRNNAIKNGRLWHILAYDICTVCSISPSSHLAYTSWPTSGRLLPSTDGIRLGGMKQQKKEKEIANDELVC